MSKRPDTWMPLYIGDYLRKTMHLTIDQHGAYLMLIMACWCEGGALLNDDKMLAGTCRVTEKKWQTKIRPAIERFFQIDDTGWHNTRVTEELEKAQQITQHRRNAGRASVAAKAEQTESKPSTLVATSVQQTDPVCSTPVTTSVQQMGTPSPSQSEGEELKGSEATPRSTYKNLTSELVAARATDESQGFLRKFEVQGGRSAPLAAAIAAKKRGHLMQKLICFSKATLAEPQLSAAVEGLCGADPEHSDQWWLDHLDKKMREQNWDDADRISA